MPIKKTDSDWLSVAVETAEKGIKHKWGGPFGAVIVIGNKVIAKACNTVLRDQDATCHAEMNAIRMACRKQKSFSLENAVIYSTTEPCPMCFSSIHWARIKKIVYSTTIEDVQKLGFNELSISNKIMKSIGKSSVIVSKTDHPPSRALLKKWASFPQKKTY